jgi:NADH pyrophosphatase NudC (nudix superfamily)
LMTASAYLFCGNALIAPVGAYEEDIILGFPIDIIEEITRDFTIIDRFCTPALPDALPVEVFTAQNQLSVNKKEERLSIRSLTRLPRNETLLRAFHLAQWRLESRFCGTCGAKNEDASQEYARRCPVCGRLEFPRISPAVITLVENERGEVALAHNKNFKDGVYSLIAGFVETGESLEDTVKREIREEISIEVDNIQYIASQPWPFPNSLMVGFCARYVSGVITPDYTEIDDAHWFTPDALPSLPASGSIARRIINAWLTKR